MIRELTIANLGVIANTRLEFGPGLTVLSGETGAGKTLITTAVSQLLGAKPDVALVRHGAAEAVIDCTLSVPPVAHAALEEIGARVQDDELIVTRTIGARSRAIVGSRAVAASVLADIVGGMVTLHGQHGQTRLTRSSEQRSLLDASDPAIRELLTIQRVAWQNARSAQAALAEAQVMQESSAAQLANLQALVDDFETVSPSVGEDVDLDARIAVVTSLDAIVRSARTVLAMLTEGDDTDLTDVATLLSQVRRNLEQRTEAPQFAAWAARAIELQEQVQALGHEIDRYLDGLDAEPDVLDVLMHRRSQVGALLRRNGCTLEELVRRYQAASSALSLSRDPGERIAELQQLTQHALAEQELVCGRLHDARTVAAAALGGRVQAELQALGLANATFSIAVRREGEATQFGDDLVEFRFSANPGQPEQALAAVGSGGELSRVMLALETATVPEQPLTFIFDEVDAGVGGRAAIELGRRLAYLARNQQVIVVTHLAQVAAFADQHVLVEKVVSAGQTTTETRILTESDRPRELARMLSGMEDSASANAHAQELLEAAAAARRGGR